MAPMRILMLTPRLPFPPDRGDKVRPWVILQALARRHQVWLASLGDEPPRPEDLQHLRRLCADVAVFPQWHGPRLWRGGVSLLGGRSVTEGWFGDPRMVALLDRWRREIQFDALWTYSSGLARLGDQVPCGRRILDLCDVESAKWQRYARNSHTPLRLLYRVEAARVEALERVVARSCDLCLMVNERERRKLIARVGPIEAEVLRTPVAIEEFSELAPPAATLPTAPVVGMLGSMFFPPNVQGVLWFGRHVWPRVRAVLPDAQWRVVGGRPVRRVRALGRLPGVEVVGYVQDIRAALAEMRVFVNPVIGDLGVQTKLIVAMAAGRPAVVTPDAAAGIDYSDPPPFLIAGAPQAFADAVVRLLRDDTQARRLAIRAYKVAHSEYDVRVLLPRIERWLRGSTDEVQPAARSIVSAERPDPVIRREVARL